MESVVAIKVKIPFKEILLETMRQYSMSVQEVIDYGYNLYTSDKRELHDLTYYFIRSHTKLPSQLVISSRDVACTILKKYKTKPIVKKYMTIRYDHRSFSIKSNIVSLSSINGRIKIPIRIPEYFNKYKNYEVRCANLFLRKNKIFLSIVVAKEVDANNDFCDNGKIVGIDFGINNIAVTSEKQFFKGVTSKLNKLQRLRSSLQSKGTKSAKRHLKRLSGRQTRFMTDTNHCISKRIVENLNSKDTVIMEALKGIRNKNRGKTMNRLLSNWSFYQLNSFIKYKSIQKGIQIIEICPWYTSKTCNRCGEVYSIRPKNCGFFKCLHCGYTCNSDFNASFNIRNRLKPLVNSRGLFVNKPIVASFT
jgi:IS605 OrfB family transposase